MITKTCLNLIKSHEGLSLRAYKCPAGYWTIGYGCRIRDNLGKFVDNSCVFENLPLQKITIVEADKMLFDRISEFEVDIKKHFKNIDKLNENQYSAFISLVYNCGISAIGVKLRNLIENDPNNFDEIRKIWLKYNKSAGKSLNGLTKRREAEMNMYCNQINNTTENIKKSQSSLSNKSMSNSILSTLADKGIDIATSFIPGGSLVQSAVKSIAKSLLGNADASESEITKAVQNASPEQLQQIQLEIAKLEAETNKEQEDTKQAVEQTKQKEFDVLNKQIDYFTHITGKEKIVTALFFYFILASLLGYFHFSDFDNITKHTVISLLSVMALLPFSPYIGGGIFNRILNSLCDIFLNIAEIGKGITAIPKVVANKVLKSNIIRH